MKSRNSLQVLVGIYRGVIMKKMQISEGCQFISGYAFKSKNFSDYGTPVIKIANIKPLCVDLDNYQCVNDEEANVPDKFNAYEDDILIAMTGQGSVGKVSIVRNISNRSFLINQRVGKIVPDEKTINGVFLYYILSSPSYEKTLHELGCGTSQPNLSPTQILSTFIPRLEYCYQKEAGKKLRILDDKIIKNISQMQFLNSIIIALYQSWFNDFNYPNATSELENGIPVGWINSNVFENVTEVREKNKDNNNYPVLSVVKEGEFKLSDNVFTKQVYSKETTNYKIVHRNQVGYNPARANIGSIAMLTDFDVGLVSPIYVVFEMKETITPTFFYYYMKQAMFLDGIKHHAIGTTRQNFPFEAFKMFPMIVPPMELQKRFEEVAKPIEQKIVKCKEENAVLAEIRDTLLPKLISGELSVKVGEE